MKIVVTEIGERRLLDWALREVSLPDPTVEIALFDASWIITRQTVWSNLQEATFTGYARIPLDRATWQAAAQVDGRAYAQYDASPLQWTAGSGPVTIYGYAALEIATTDLVWGARFSVPRVLTVGAMLDVLAVLTSLSESDDGQ